MLPKNFKADITSEEEKIWNFEISWKKHKTEQNKNTRVGCKIEWNSAVKNKKEKKSSWRKRLQTEEEENLKGGG